MDQDNVTITHYGGPCEEISTILNSLHNSYGCGESTTADVAVLAVTNH